MMEIITGILSNVFAQSGKEFISAKTNRLAMVTMTYGMTLVAGDIYNILGNFYIVISLFAWTMRDTLAKIGKK